MQKFTIAEILRTRKIGTLGKHSTLDDIIAIYGEPDIYLPDPMRNNENYSVVYGSLWFAITARKKRIYELSMLPFLTISFFEEQGLERILSDAHILYDYSQKEIEDYFLQHDIELQVSEDINYDYMLETYYPKLCKRPFTKVYPSFEVKYDLEDKRIYHILMYYDYRSKTER